MPQWALHLLGSPRLERDGSRVEIQRRKVMALLIYLAVTGKSHSRDTLAALFWPEHDQVSARAAFRRALSDLQKTLRENRILVEQDSIHLELTADFVLDINEFRRRLEAHRAHAHHPSDPCPDCLTALTEAVLLYKGDFLSGFTLSDSLEFDEWQMLQTEILHRELIGALSRLVLGHAAIGEIEAAIYSAQHWLALDPVDEVAHRHLMQLYSWSDKRSQALRQYQECVRILERELGVSPQAETTALYEHIRAKIDTQPPEGIPRLKPISLPRKPNNLPVQLTSFVGRAAELAAVSEEISRPDVHLLTLTGPGGVGKTRLSLEVAAQLLDQFEDGAFFIPLAPLHDPALVSPTIAHALGIRESKSTPLLETLKDYVRSRQMLLVLDNFEHLTPAAPRVTELLASAPRLKILVTSRTLLHVYGEHLHPVLPMTLPRAARKASLETIARSEAVQFFVNRARAVKVDFTLKDENCQAVSEICVRLDGLPLAIELAAARVRQITPQAILGQWTQDGSRTPLQTLTHGPRDLPARHQTLRNAIAWSYNLLEAHEQKVFQRAGIFVGGWSLEAAEKVIADPMPNSQAAVSTPAESIANLLESLVDKALLEQSDRDGETRNTMLETVREYALEQLAACEELDVFHDRHTAYYLAFAENARQNLTGSQQSIWVNRLAQEYDNLRAALKWAVDHQKAETALRLGGALGRFWYIYDPIYWSEGRSWLEQALRLPMLEPIPHGIQAKALNEAGVLAWVQADHPQAIRRFEESLALRRKLGDKTGIASALGNLGLVAREQLDLPRARAYQEECLALRRETVDKQGTATALSNLGLVTADQGDWAYATVLYEESIALNRELQNKSGLTMTLHNLGGLLVENLEDFARAKALLEESLALSHELGKNFFLIPYTLNHLGDLALYQKDNEQARELFEQGLTLSRESNNTFGIGYNLHGLGSLYAVEGEDEKAQEWFQKSVLTLQEVNGLVGIVWDFISMAGVAWRRGRPVRAATLLGASESLREKIFASLLAVKSEEYQRNLKAARAQLADADFDQGWAAGRAMSLAQAVAYAANE